MAQKTMTWETVYVFISSTFNDMHAERDYLVKRVFPELSEWCEERKLRLVDIDLRWGVTEKDSQENKRVVDVCLSNIDRCRPLFLCFLGQRRGWVPGESDIAGTTFGNFPKLKQYLGSSVTEMEIIHAIIDPMLNGSVMELKNRERAFFFLRDPGYLSDVKSPALRRIYTNEADLDPVFSDRQLEVCKDRIRKTGRPVFSYIGTWDEEARTPELQSAGTHEEITAGRLTDFRIDGKELSEIILEQLKGAISGIWPGREPARGENALQKELDEQARFLQTAREGFIERTGDFDAARAYLSGDDHRPCAVCAEAGMGKTSWLAELVGKLQEEGSFEILYRFVGTSEGSVSQTSLLISIAQELRQRFGLEHVSDAPQKIREVLADLFGKAAQKKPLVVVIDAVNQLDTALEDLGWIPAYLPDRVKFLYSFKLDKEHGQPLLEELKADKENCILQLRGFDDVEDRKAIVRQYLSLYLKELDEKEIDAIVTSEGASNPLFLKILLSELRVFGSHEGLHEKITKQFGTTPLSAFGALLARLEQDPVYSGINMKELALHVLGWLSHAHNGLEPQEAADLLCDHGIAPDPETARDSVNLILRQLRAFLARREKRVDFFYESFFLAAARRYTAAGNGGKPDAEWHKDLAEYFRKRNYADSRKLSEQAWQFAKAGMTADLKALLIRYNFLERRIYHTTLRGLLDDYGLVSLPEAGVSEEEQGQFLLIREALEMGASAITISVGQLAVQLYGRLMGFDLPYIQKLLRDTAEFKRKNKVSWLRPLCTFLPPPGSRILRYYKTTAMNGVQIFRDRKRMLIYTKDDGMVKVIRIADGKILRNYPLKAEPHWIWLAEDEGVFAVREMYTLYFVRLDSGERYDAEGIKGINGSQFACGNGLLACTGSDLKTHVTNIYVTDIKSGELVYTVSQYRDPSKKWVSAFAAAIDRETGYLLMSASEQGADWTDCFDPRKDFSPVRRYRCEEKYFRRSDAVFNRIWVPEFMSCVITLTEFDGLTIYDKETGEVLLHKTIIGTHLTTVCFSDDNRWLVTAHLQNISVISLEEYRETSSFSVKQGENSVSAMAFLPDRSMLYIGRSGCQIEVWNVQTGKKITEYPDMNWQVLELYPDPDTGSLLCIGKNTAAVMDLNRETIPGDRGVTGIETDSLAVSPDNRFIIVTTPRSDGNIYRMDLPGMQPRVIVNGRNAGVFHYTNVKISCDAAHFGVIKKHNEWFVFDSRNGEPAAEMKAVDVDHTGDMDAQWIRNPRFLPEELCLGDRNLSILYHQNGCFVIQDPDAPGKTRVLRVFPGGVGWNQSFDGGRKLAAFSSISVFDPAAEKLKTREDPSLDDGAKILDLKTGECLEHTDDRKHVYIASEELDDWPAIQRGLEKLCDGQYQWKKNYIPPVRFLCKEKDRLLYGRGGNANTPFAVFSADSNKQLGGYYSEDRFSCSVNNTSDGRYIFLIYGYRLCPFRLENVLCSITDMTEAELDKQAFALSGNKTVECLEQALCMYEELTQRYPEKERHLKNRDITKEQLAFALSKHEEIEDKEKACVLYKDLAERYPEVTRHANNVRITRAQIALKYYKDAENGDRAAAEKAYELYSGLAEEYPERDYGKNAAYVKKHFMVQAPAE